jgi:hypothetical protein
VATSSKQCIVSVVSSLVAGMSLSSASCMMEVDKPEARVELDAIEAEVIGDADEPAYFQETWTQYDGGSKDIAAYDKYWCALTGVTGYFRGLGEEVRLKRADAAVDKWRLTVKSKQPEGNVGATVTCYHREGIKRGEGLNVVSGEWTVAQTSPDECDDWIGCPVVDHGDPAPTLAKAWNGDAATMITGLTGNFRGWGEFVTVEQSANGDEQSLIGAQTLKSDQQTSRIYAHSYYAGRKDRPAILTLEYKLSGVKNTQSKKLANAKTHMCYLAYMGGSLGKKTSIAIKEDKTSGRWLLEVKGTSSDAVSANARCVALDQR